MVDRPKRLLLIFVAIIVAMGVHVRAAAERVPAEEDQGILITRPAAGRRDPGPHARVLEQVSRLLPRRRKRTTSRAVHGRRLQLRRQRAERGLAFIRSRLGRAHAAKNDGQARLRGAPPRPFADPRRAGVRADAAGDPRAGQSQGFDFELQDIRGTGHDELIEGARPAARDGRPETKLLATSGPTTWKTSRSSTSTSTRRKRARSGLACRDINSTLSAAWGRHYVNDFIDRGRVKRVYRAGGRALPHAAGGPRQVVRARRVGTWCRSPPSRPATGPTGRRGWRATTASPPSRSRASGAGRELGRRDGRDRAAGIRNCRRARPRMDRPVVPGAAVEQPGAVALRDLAPGHVPVPRRALRKLVDAVRGDAGGAARRRRRGARRHLARPDERRLFPGRAADDDGPGGQERDPDRRVRHAQQAAGWG